MKILQKKNLLFVSLLSMMLLASCTSYKKVPYLQNSNEWSSMEQAVAVYEPKIQPSDLLNILITTLHGLHPATSLIDDVGSMNGTFTNIMRIVCLVHIVYAVSYNMQVRDATFAVGV